MQTTTKKGKEGTKGAKQILKENAETLNFYRNMVFGANAIYLVCILIFSSFGWSEMLLLFLAICSYAGSFRFLSFMAKAKLTDSGQITDPGIDLNMTGGLSEHAKDLIILTAGCQILSLYSNYFWLLWLLVPGRATWLLWSSILAPYFFRSNEEPEEVNEKKQKKLERKMKRQNR